MKNKIALFLTFIMFISCTVIDVQGDNTYIDAKVPFNMSIVTTDINGNERTFFDDDDSFIIKYIIDPQIIPYNDVTKDKDKEVVLVVDTSGSMEDKTRYNNKKMSRISAVKKILRNFVSKLSTGSNIKISIVDFNSKANVVQFNSKVFADLDDSQQITKINDVVNSLSADGGTNTGDGLRLAYYNLLNSGNDDAEKYIILLTDGEPTFYTKSKGWIEGHYEKTTKWVEGYYDDNRNIIDEFYFNGKKIKNVHRKVYNFEEINENSVFIKGRYKNITGRYNSNSWHSGYYYIHHYYDNIPVIRFNKSNYENINGRYETQSTWVERKWSNDYTYYYGDIELPDEYENYSYYYYFFDKDNKYFIIPRSNSTLKGSEYVLNVAETLLGNNSDDINITTHVIGFNIDSNNNKAVAQKSNNTNLNNYYHVASNGDDIDIIYSQIGDEIIQELPLEQINFNAKLPNEFNVNPNIEIETIIDGTVKKITNISTFLNANTNTITGSINDVKYVLNDSNPNNKYYEADPIIIKIKVNRVFNNGTYIIGDINPELDDLSKLNTYIEYKDLDGSSSYRVFPNISRTISNTNLPNMDIHLDMVQDSTTAAISVTVDDKTKLSILNTNIPSEIVSKIPYTMTKNVDLKYANNIENNFSVEAEVYNDISDTDTVSTLNYIGEKWNTEIPNENKGNRTITLNFEAESGIIELTSFIVDGKSITGSNMISEGQLYSVDVLLNDGINKIISKAKNKDYNTTNLYFEKYIDAMPPEIQYEFKGRSAIKVNFNEKVNNFYLYFYKGKEIRENLKIVNLKDNISEDGKSALISFNNSWYDYNTAYFKADDEWFNRGTKSFKEFNNDTFGSEIYHLGLYLNNTYNTTPNVVKNFKNTYGTVFSTNGLDDNIYLCKNNADKYTFSNIRLFKANDEGDINLTPIESNITISDSNELEISTKLSKKEIYAILFDAEVNAEVDSTVQMDVMVGNAEDSIILKIKDLPELE